MKHLWWVLFYLLSSFVVFVEPPPVVGTLLDFDKANMFCNRLINSNLLVYFVLTEKYYRKNEAPLTSSF